jgi:hypothetical protein
MTSTWITGLIVGTRWIERPALDEISADNWPPECRCRPSRWLAAGCSPLLTSIDHSICPHHQESGSVNYISNHCCPVR